MWANHDAGALWDKRLSDDNKEVVWRGALNAGDFGYVCDRLIDKYFHHPSYYTINGCPVFMIYDIANLAGGLGGVEETRKAMDRFRDKAARAGFPGLHLQLTGWGENVDFSHTGVDTQGPVKTKDIFVSLGFDSMTNYQFVQLFNVKRPYAQILPELETSYRLFGEQFKTYFPHVSIGWDNNPRFIKTLDNLVTGNEPGEFEKGLLLAKAYADSHPGQRPLITLNSWNEWTETSYLEPDDLYGYGYLEAVKRVFKQ